jgi:hypothetical protein
LDLSRITAVIRPRSAWESIDLGFALARAWFLPLWLCWWVTAVPVGLLALIPLHGRPDLWLLLLWWCKPGFEALPLYWTSRALFGERLAVSAAARHLPQALPPRLWPQLLWRRIGITRSFSMPVTLLEAPRGGARRARLRVLGTGAAGWLTIVCVHLETVLWLSALLTLVFLLPEGAPELDLEAAVLESGSMADWIASVLMLLAVSVLAPFYVAAGFALYLGRRTELEAWDLELAFRRTRPLAARRAMAPALMAPLLMAALLLHPAAPAQALTQEEARAAVDAVLADPDFGGSREEHLWVYVGSDRPEPDYGAQPWVPDWLLRSLAVLGEWLLLIAAAVITALLVLQLLRGLPRRRRKPVADPLRPARVTDTTADTGADPLPPDIPDTVRRLLAAGDARGALALLYRGQIARLRRAGLALTDSATEKECIAAARARTTAAEQAWLQRLVALWQEVAYGHRPPDPAALASLLDGHAAPPGGADGR